MTTGAYSLVTPVRNEAAFLEETIRSVLGQSVLPAEWIIVSDGSADGTDEIAGRYAGQGGIRLMRVSTGLPPGFAAKAAAFNEALKGLDLSGVSFVGNLDGDIVLPGDYYERILTRLSENPRLGIAGGQVLDLIGGVHRERVWHHASVAGAVQLFRRECLQALGGYVPMPHGGIDAVAEVRARMHGWEVRTFPEIRVLHQRRTGATDRHPWKAKFRSGVRDYHLGHHPLFMVVKMVNRLRERPFVLGGLAILGGYAWAACQRKSPDAPPAVVAHLRREQMARLREAVTGLLGRTPGAGAGS